MRQPLKVSRPSKSLFVADLLALALWCLCALWATRTMLIAAARKVERVHAAKPEVPAGLADELESFWDEMESHMHKEEHVLFPMLRRGGRGPMVAPPISVMRRLSPMNASPRSGPRSPRYCVTNCLRIAR